MATTTELRNKLVSTAAYYLGAKQGSAQHKAIIDIFNQVKPDGWAYCNSVTSTTITATGTDKKVPITALHSGSGFSYDSTEKGIKCNKAGQYMVSCSLSANPATSPDLMGVSIYKNGATSVGPEYKRVNGNYDVVILPPSPITLAEGDILTLYGRNNSSARGAFTACRFTLWEV